MKLLSLNELSEITGKTNATVKKRLVTLNPYSKRGNVNIYNSVEALIILYEAEKVKGDYDLEQERARLASEQADGKSIDNARKRRELILIDDVCEAVATEYEILRKRLFICSDVASTNIVDEYELDQKEKHNVRKMVQASVNEALEELSADKKEVVENKVISIEKERDSRKIT